MAKSIAKISGTMLKPGVSRNGRLYTVETIKKAVARAQNRIGEGGPPLTMLTHHSADDDSTQVVGRVSHVYLAEDGSAKFHAELADTTTARTILNLIDTTDDSPPFLQGVSIRGGWIGPTRHTVVGGRMAEHGDDLEFFGLDMTKNPGVPGAMVDSVTRTELLPVETATGKSLIYESVDAVVHITEETPKAEIEEKGAPALKSGKAAAPPTPGASKYADPGYQDDKAKRYPLDTIAHSRAAWSYINMPKNAAAYTAPQLKQIKGRIAAALRKFGVKISAKEGWAIYPLVEEAAPVVEGPMDIWPDVPGSYSLSIDNGMVHICISSCRVDPADLEMCARAAMEGACAALAQMDPDSDGDIDADGKSDDDRTESILVTTTVHESNEQEESEVADQPTTTAAEESPPATIQPAVTLTAEQFQQLLASIAPPAPVMATAESVSGPAPAVAEVTPTEAGTVEETTEQMVARLVTEGIKAGLAGAVQEHVAQHGPPPRKGIVSQVTETAGGNAEYPAGWPTDEGGSPLPAHKLSNDQWKHFSRPMVEQAVMGRKSVYAQQS